MMQPASRPLAILGGTFDPVHIAHLRVAWEAAHALNAELRLMPANVPPHRPQPVATALQRLAILEAALSGQDRLQVDARELAREGRSYTIDTLIDLRLEIGPARPLVLLVGEDAFAGLPGWHRWKELFHYAHVGVLARPAAAAIPADLKFEIDERGQDAAEVALRRPHGAILRIAVTPLAISATQLRHLLRMGEEPRYLVPDAVLANPRLLDPYRAIDSDSPA